MKPKTDYWWQIHELSEKVRKLEKRVETLEYLNNPIRSHIDSKGIFHKKPIKRHWWQRRK